MQSRWLVAGAILLIGGALALVVGRQESAGERLAEDRRGGNAGAVAPRSSHERMLALLRDIRDRTADENLWLGDREAKAARSQLAALPAGRDPLERWRLLREVAEHELRLGNEQVAIARFEEAYALLQVLSKQLDREQAADTAFRLGIGWLRYGETRNCTQRHNAESCILPIRGGGIHDDPEGSRRAMGYFLEAADAMPRDTHLHLKAVWLLNIAAMTLGEHPQGVPERYRIPPAVFGSDQPFPHFDNVAPALGLASFNLYGGAVFDDFTGDGWPDLFVTSADTAESPRLFRNDRDGSFTEISQEAGLAGLFGGINAVQADYDNDGDLDLLVLRGAWLSVSGRHPESLLRNELVERGKPGFTDVTFDAGLAEALYPTHTGGWGDYDNDGDLDLYLGHEHQQGTLEAPSQLFRNQGDGTFTDVAAQAGVLARRFVKGVVWGDYDGDRYPDLYVSVNGGPNRLYHNDRDGTFTDVAVEAGVTLPLDAFPCWFWDYDNDGALDLYVASYRGVQGAVANVAASYFGAPAVIELASLYRGDGRGGFEDVAQRLGLRRLHLAMGANFGDLDGDGWLDFYLGTGYPDYEGLMPNVMYRNVEGRAFADVTLAGGFGHLQKGHAVAFVDFDHDGDQDVFEEMGGAFPGDHAANVLYRNPGFGNRWLAVELRGVRSNRSAIGARLRVDFLEGGRRRTLFRNVSSGGSFGANPLRQQLGLGKASRIERLEVYWPTSDMTQSFSEVPLDAFVRIAEGEDRLETLTELQP